MGGTSGVAMTGGTANVASLDVQSNATGGSGDTASGTRLAAFAGNGTGGTARVQLISGSLTATDTTIEAFGTGADGVSHSDAGAATDGGIGTGGTASLLAPAGSTAAFSTATLTIRANGQGGDGGNSGTGTNANGGHGFGATGAADLADGAWTLGTVLVEATGTGGFSTGANGGEGSGGEARFAVIDGSGPIAARTLDGLTLDGSGFGGTGIGGTAASDAGQANLTAQVLNPAAALGFTNDLLMTSVGTRSAPGPGIAIAVGGAPLTVGGNITLNTTRDVTITAPQALHALGNVNATARAVTETGLLDADGTLSVIGTDGVTAQSLASAGTTLLQAVNGAVTVSTDLASAGLVTVLGRSVDITSLGALSIADAQATAGNLRVAAAGDLTSASAQATGTATLTGGGAFTATGPVTGSTVALFGNTGLTAGTVTSGGTTSLVSPNGTVSVTALTSPGAVTAQGRTLDLHSPGALAFTDAQATAGNLLIDTQGNLTLAQGNTSGGLTLSSANGAITAAGPLGAGGNTSITAPLGVDLAGLTSGGTTLLRATGGAVAVDNLLSTGLVTALGRSIDIASTGALSFADLDATAGGLSVLTAGNLTLATVDATGAVTLASSAGALLANGAVNGGGAVGLTGKTGLTAGTVVSSGTTSLSSPNGTVSVTNLTSSGAVTALGRALDLHSPGALSFVDAHATAGHLLVDTQGNLTLAAGSATGAMTLSSVNGAILATGALTAGGNSSIIAPLGVDLASLTSGGTTLLRATGGALRAGNLNSTGLVTALGRSVDLTSTGALSFADLDATAGNLSVQTAGNLAVTTADATGALALRSTGAALRATGTVAGATIQLTAGSDIRADANLASARTLAADAGGTFTLAGLARGTAITVRSSDIALGNTAAIGVRGFTQTLALTNTNPARTMFVGGGADPSGYSLDSAEAPRLFADSSITLGVAGAGNMTVGDLALTFGANGNIGAGGLLELTSPASVSILGDVALRTVGAGDRFTIDPQLVSLNTDTGSIAMLDAGGNPLGRLGMTGNTVALATGAVLGQLATAPGMAAMNALLDAPGGTPQPLRAGSIAFSVTGGLYIQNSGPSGLYRDRRGFETPALAITPASNATRIAINGQILTAGGPVTGLDAQPLVTINGLAAAAGGQVDPGSTINGCLIGGVCAPPPGTNPPPNGDLTGPVPQGTPPGALFTAPLVQLAATDPLIAPPLVDEPITGVGNDDLWQPSCGRPEGDQPCPEANEDK
jgi:hypothetical protein